VQFAELSRRRSCELLTELIQAHPKCLECRELLARLLVDSADLMQGNPEQIEDQILAYRKAIVLWEGLIADGGSRPKFRVGLSYGLNGLGTLLYGSNRIDDAMEPFEKALKIRQALADEFPRQASCLAEFGGTTCNIGNVLIEGKVRRPAEALLHFDRATEILERAIKVDPSHVNAKHFLAATHWGKFVVFVRTKRFAEAEKESDEALKMYSASARLDRQIVRGFEYAEAGEHARAVKEADSIVGRKGSPPDTTFRCAQILTIASSKAKDDHDLAERYARRAIELLGQARKERIFPDKVLAEALEKDKLFESLRKRDDFQKLLREIAATKP
jgi:tetratricopeptide (TPR) repeat protein